MPSPPEAWVQGGILGAAFWLFGTVAVPFGKAVLDRLERVAAAVDRHNRATLIAVAAMRQVDRETREAARDLIREIDADARPRRRHAEE